MLEFGSTAKWLDGLPLSVFNPVKRIMKGTIQLSSGVSIDFGWFDLFSYRYNTGSVMFRCVPVTGHHTTPIFQSTRTHGPENEFHDRLRKVLMLSKSPFEALVNVQYTQLNTTLRPLEIPLNLGNQHMINVPIEDNNNALRVSHLFGVLNQLLQQNNSVSKDISNKIQSWNNASGLNTLGIDMVHGVKYRPTSIV